MEVGQIGETGVHVSVITALELEHGTELDLASIQLLIALEGINYVLLFDHAFVIIVWMRHRNEKPGLLENKPIISVTVKAKK